MTTQSSIKLFNFDILNATASDAMARIFSGIGKQTVAFLNAHCINVASKDPNYRWALNKANTLLPDGSGLQLAARFSGNKFIENLNGTDLFPTIMTAAAAHDMKVFLFGSQDGIAASAAKKAQSLVADVKIAGTRHGFFKPSEEDDIIAEINDSGADVVLVALGVPRQEIWIARNRHKLNAKIVFGVGAQFDFWAERVSRAPMLLRKTGMEWLWRLAIEPRRMFKRYILGNPAFVGRALRDQMRFKVSKNSGSIAKRLLDMALSGGALVALAPLFAFIMAAIKLETRGPAFFTQIRVGENGETFKIYKFRSMYPDAEERRQAILKLSSREGICFKSRNDPRVTKVGRVLRRFSLDELPQILNVWQGEMAIVGPRPALMQEVTRYPAKALGRLGAKPGLTGLWQVSGRAEISFNKMINMDMATVKSRTIFCDIGIILLTFRAVITGRGAY